MKKKLRLLGIMLAPKLRAACDAAAGKAGIRLSDWVRGLLERETGVDGGRILMGFAGMPAKKALAIQRAGGKSGRKKNLGCDS